MVTKNSPKVLESVRFVPDSLFDKQLLGISPDKIPALAHANQERSDGVTIPPNLGNFSAVAESGKALDC